MPSDPGRYNAAMVKRLAFAGLFAAAVLTWIAIGRAQDNATDAARLIEVLQLDAGDVVAEVGAGDGSLTIAIARHVGPSGRVFTSELAGNLERLRNAISKSGLSHIEVVEGKADSANVPDGCCDALFLRNVYHHFSAPAAMNASFLRALKPGGRLVIIDFPPRGNAATAAPEQRGERSSHGVSADTVVNELKAAGFEVTTTEARQNRWFLVAAVKPVE
jgi:ubiquinone/menaquinone biosynthesis C-methylase UbiE